MTINGMLCINFWQKNKESFVNIVNAKEEAEA